MTGTDFAFGAAVDNFTAEDRKINTLTQTTEFSPSIFCWALISPNKKGSFEDYLWSMGKEASRRGWRYIVCVAAPVKTELQHWLLDSGCELICLDDHQINNADYIIQLLKAHKIDIIHTHFVGPTDSTLLKIKLQWRGKIVFTDHSSNSLIPEYQGNIITKHLRTIKRFILSQCISTYLPVSNFVAERIARNIPNAKPKIHRLYNGIDVERFEPNTSAAECSEIKSRILGVDDNKPIVAFVGQIIVEKGIDLFINVMKNILNDNVDCRFVIVGNGSCKDEVAKVCQQDEFKDRAQYLGPRSDVNDILRVTDIFVMPSQWGEAFGLTAAEAAATAVPIIASRVGGLPEVVIDQHSGLLVELNDQQGLEDAIREMLSQPEKRKQYGLNGRLHAERNFLLSDMITQTFDHYQNLLPQTNYSWGNNLDPKNSNSTNTSVEGS